MSASSHGIDQRVRMAAFDWLSRQSAMLGDVLPREMLARGFAFEGLCIPPVGPQGIFKPQVLPDIPLSITTTPGGPYDDSLEANDLLLYRYRGADVHHRDNEGLRNAMIRRTPLIYFHGIVPGRYLAIWPVYIVGDNPKELAFSVAADDPALLADTTAGIAKGVNLSQESAEPRRAYITATVKQRVHQRGFREQVLRAYREQCACCRLRHVELLDAAHIMPDSDPRGVPIVSNGIALCKLHHAAFDANLYGIKPDYIIEVREDVLEEIDGPMLLHGLKSLHKQKIVLPTRLKLLPDPLLLEHRFKEFRKAM